MNTKILQALFAFFVLPVLVLVFCAIFTLAVQSF